ncbi:multiple resistance and pH regulation protein F [Xanthobacter sp. AM11]|uniref:multiple resistance and pH regulation protein F n=1 Tax=Xanthobacter sp. AM11 TaxID=3380643 RepID=UPI0039BF6078
MADLLLAGAAVLLVTVALGLAGLWRGGSAADLLLAVQLLGTAGVALLLLLAVATPDAAILDVAVLLAVLAAFAAAAFRACAPASPGPGAGEGTPGRRP